MGRRAPLVLTVTALLVAGCGDEGGGEDADRAAGALVYLPSDADLVALLSTDLSGDAWNSLWDVSGSDESPKEESP